MCCMIASEPYLTPCTIQHEQEQCFFQSNPVTQRSTTRMFHRRWHSKILHCSTTIPLSSLESCLRVFDQTAKKLHPATLDEATPYVNTQRFLPPPWNDMTHGVQQLCAHHVHQTLDGGDPCPLGRLNFLACEVAHLWARWLRNPCHLGDPLRFRVGGQNQKWPTCGQGGYVTPAASGIPSASE